MSSEKGSSTVRGVWLSFSVKITNQFHTKKQNVAGSNDIRAEEALHRTACNVVIFGERGAGKSSLVNLIARTQTAPTSRDALGCTTETNVYERDVVIQNKILKVKLFDTPGQCGSPLLVSVTELDCRS